MRATVATRASVAFLTAGGLVIAGASAASAGPPAGPTVTVLSTDVSAPLQLASGRGRVYVADSGRSTVTVLGQSQPLVVGPRPGEIAGVAVAGGSLAYTSTDYRTGATALTVRRDGRPPVVSDLSGFEAAHNPDSTVSYGVPDSAPAACKAQADQTGNDGPPASYTGVVDSHPYAVASLGGGSWVVADAAGNDLLRVDRSGRVSLLAVLPPQPLTFTPGQAEALGAPACAGVTYAFEAVPTDVEVGPDGMLYVTTLPGGPEGPVLGARGSVYRVDPDSGATSRIATGFAGATNLAFGRGGRIYVAELFAGRISTVVAGGPQPFVSLPGVVSVQDAPDGTLYAGTLPADPEDPAGSGTVVRVDPGSGR